MNTFHICCSFMCLSEEVRGTAKADIMLALLHTYPHSQMPYYSVRSDSIAFCIRSLQNEWISCTLIRVAVSAKKWLSRRASDALNLLLFCGNHTGQTWVIATTAEARITYEMCAKAAATVCESVPESLGQYAIIGRSWADSLRDCLRVAGREMCRGCWECMWRSAITNKSYAQT